MTDSPSASGKGRPTPKRKDSQKRRSGPVAPPPANRREAARRIREQGKEQRAQTKRGASAGEPRYLMKRDQGPIRQLVRNVVDSRRHVGVLLLPAALLPVLAQLTGSPQVLALATTLWLGALLAAVADFSATAFLVRRRIRSDFPGDAGRGHLFYATMRTAQFRRFRMPKPVVQVGEQV